MFQFLSVIKVLWLYDSIHENVYVSICLPTGANYKDMKKKLGLSVFLSCHNALHVRHTMAIFP